MDGACIQCLDERRDIGGMLLVGEITPVAVPMLRVVVPQAHGDHAMPGREWFHLRRKVAVV